MNDPERRSVRRWRRWSLRLLVLLIGFGVAVYGLELTMRWFDLFGVNHGRNTLRYRTEALRPTWFAPDGSRDLDGSLYRHKASTTTSFGRFEIAANSLGFRGPELAVPKPAGTFRIVVLGDSVTLGWGIDDEFTFCRRVERELNGRGDGRRYEVVNTGHLAYDTTQEAAVFEREALALQPDLVVLVFVTNDVVEPTYLLIKALLDGTPIGDQAPTWRDHLAHQGERFLPACTALLRNVLARVGAGRASGADGSDLKPEGNAVWADGWERSQRALRRVRDLCRARALPFLVFDHTLPRLPALATFCAAEGISRHDFWFTPDELGKPIYNSMIDTHANALGNELLAAKALRILQAAGVLPH